MTFADPSNETEPVKHLSDKRILIPYLAPRRKIGIDGFVYFEGRRYGVPYSYAGKVVRVMRSQEQLYILDSETFAQIERHDVDWSYSPHYSDFQFEPFQPEELPTMPVTASIEFRKDPDDDFSRYDF